MFRSCFSDVVKKNNKLFVRQISLRTRRSDVHFWQEAVLLLMPSTIEVFGHS